MPHRPIKPAAVKEMRALGFTPQKGQKDGLVSQSHKSGLHTPYWGWIGGILPAFEPSAGVYPDWSSQNQTQAEMTEAALVPAPPPGADQPKHDLTPFLCWRKVKALGWGFFCDPQKLPFIYIYKKRLCTQAFTKYVSFRLSLMEWERHGEDHRVGFVYVFFWILPVKYCTGNPRGWKSCWLNPTPKNGRVGFVTNDIMPPTT